MVESNDAMAPWALLSNNDGLSASRFERIEHTSALIPVEVGRALTVAGLLLEHRTVGHNAALARAGFLISMLPDLWNIISCRIRCVGVLRSTDDCYDISHSDPEWPDVIFVSIPPHTPIGDLRLAEGIVHEAMHHHLSALEERVCLVALGDSSYSPWKDGDRPVSGVLHGLYVFGCIAHALRQLIDIGALDALQELHARNRIVEIAEEFNAVDHEAISSALTIAGKEICAGAMKSLRFASRSYELAER